MTFVSTTNFLGGHAPERTDNQDAFSRFGWFCSGMRCRWHPPGPYLEKLGGFAPKWVVLLRNRAMLEACFGGKIAILGGFAPEFLSGLFTQILGGHAPVRAPQRKNIAGGAIKSKIIRNFAADLLSITKRLQSESLMTIVPTSYSLRHVSAHRC